MAQSISGTVNQSVYLGTYNLEDGTYTEDAPLGVYDFIFTVNDDGMCWVNTDRLFHYDDITGNFYLIKEEI